MKNIRQNIRNRITANTKPVDMNRYETIQLMDDWNDELADRDSAIKTIIESVKQFKKEYDRAVDKFDSIPSIKTGEQMELYKSLLENAVRCGVDVLEANYGIERNEAKVIIEEGL